jgi:hypothetical protein
LAKEKPLLLFVVVKRLSNLVVKKIAILMMQIVITSQKDQVLMLKKLQNLLK